MPDKTKNGAQVHRFHKRAAIALFNAEGMGWSETVYLNPKAARKLAKALNAVARSIERESFAASAIGTQRITDEG